MPEDYFRPDLKHPEPWRSDLNPDALAGQNIGVLGPHAETDARTAHDIKGLHRRLEGFGDDELKTIPVLPPGSRLEQGATYVDLRDPDCREFTAMGHMEATREHWYVPKDQVDYRLWNRLIGVRTPERLGQAPEA